MSCVMMRSFYDSGLLHLSDEARQRAKEYLKSVGYRDEDLQPIVWPEDAVSAHRDWSGDPWKFTTRADLKQRKIEHLEEHLRLKREVGIVRRVPLYVWVFHVPGFFFGGWWTYIIGRDLEHGGKYLQTSNLILRAMELFPIIDPKLFNTEQDWEERDRWMIEFVKRYQRGTWHGKPQGKAPVWGEASDGDIIRILGRAQWPKKVRRFN